MMDLLQISSPPDATLTEHRGTSFCISALILNIAPDFSRQFHALDQNHRDAPDDV
jgi:hypothetical protein